MIRNKLIKDTLSSVPDLPQAQYSLKDQLKELRIIANKMGLYDASDFLRSFCE